MTPASAMNRRDPIAILGVPFDNVTTAETLTIITGLIASRQPHCAATVNAEFIVQALEDVELRRILFDMHLVLPDGTPVVWASKILGNPLRERVAGATLIPCLLAEAETRGWRVFLLGGNPETMEQAAKNTLAKYPRLQLAGAYAPPVQSLLEMDHADILRRLHEAKPDVLLVGFGCPKQEKWINMHFRQAGVPFCLGAGTTIEFLAGAVRRAPLWMYNTGTDWFYRLLQQPRRQLEHYRRDLWVFGRLVLRQAWQLRSWKKSAAPRRPDAVTADTAAITVLKPADSLNAAEVRQHRDAWLAAVEQRHVIVDLTETRMVDSTGFGLLIRLRKRSRELGRGLVLLAPNSQVRAALRLMQLEDFFALENTLDAARLRVEKETGSAQSAVLQARTDIMVIRWRGEVTADSVPDLAARTQAQLDHLPAGHQVMIDLTGVVFVDSTGVGFMIRLRKNYLQRNLVLNFCEPNLNILNVLQHLKIDEYLLGGSK
jgi:N-acetylglucosaminyldiphosphoundecaprenol N-acetyl-beta-D-mannosaminyltransferase